MLPEAASPPRAAGIHPSPAASCSSTGSCSIGGSAGVEEYDSFDDLKEERALDRICGDPKEEKLHWEFLECLLRNDGASRAVLRQAATMRDENLAAIKANHRQVAAQRKAMRDRIKALRSEVARKEDEERRRLAARNDEGLRRLTEYTDLLEADMSARYTDAQLVEYKQDLDRRSKELFGGGCGGGDGA